MQRRSFLLASAAAPMLGAAPSGDTGSKVEFEIKRLKLRHTWTTVMSSSDYRDTFFLKLTRDGVTGVGEAPPSSVTKRALKWRRKP